MAVPTLPIIGTPSLEFFQFLDNIPLLPLVIVLFVWQVYMMVTLRWHYTGEQDQVKWLNYKLIQVVGNNVCVILFPNLFKKHKQCRGSNERTFILFLDRDIENQLKLKGAFYSLAFSILSASALVFFRLFPVALSDECLEKDALLRPLFCYTNQSNFPVDCAEFTNNTTREFGDSFEVVCYALSTNVGLAVAAAVGFAKVVAVLVTVYARAGEYWFKKEWNRWCFIILSIIAFAVVTGVAAVYVIISIGATIRNTPEATGELFARYVYIFLPVLAVIPFGFIAWTLDTHCQQNQYSTLSPDQVPSTVGSSTPINDVPSDSSNRNYQALDQAQET